MDDLELLLNECPNLFIGQPNVIEIPFELINGDDGLAAYNALIRQSVQHRFGVYFWEFVTNEDVELVYIGMAGKVKTDGTIGNHPLVKRLTASRGKDPLNPAKDLQTNEYLRRKMEGLDADNLVITVFKTLEENLDGIPPAYAESKLLKEHLSLFGNLPRFNNSF